MLGPGPSRCSMGGHPVEVRGLFRSMETPVEGVLAARYEELKLLIQTSDLARGTKRLLDLAKDFRPRRELLNEAILLAAEYGRLVEDERRFGPTDSTEHARNRLL